MDLAAENLINAAAAVARMVAVWMISVIVHNNYQMVSVNQMVALAVRPSNVQCHAFQMHKMVIHHINRGHTMATLEPQIRHKSHRIHHDQILQIIHKRMDHILTQPMVQQTKPEPTPQLLNQNSMAFNQNQLQLFQMCMANLRIRIIHRLWHRAFLLSTAYRHHPYHSIQFNRFHTAIHHRFYQLKIKFIHTHTIFFPTTENPFLDFQILLSFYFYSPFIFKFFFVYL